MTPEKLSSLSQWIIPFSLATKKVTERYLYFLCRYDEVVYIGQTKNLAQRIQTHLTTRRHGKRKKFDRVFYAKFSVDLDAITRIELKCIEYFKPQYNAAQFKRENFPAVTLQHLNELIIFHKQEKQWQKVKQSTNALLPALG